MATNTAAWTLGVETPREAACSRSCPATLAQGRRPEVQPPPSHARREVPESDRGPVLEIACRGNPIVMVCPRGVPQRWAPGQGMEPVRPCTGGPRTDLLTTRSHTMRAFDLSPLFSTTVGFDRMARMLEQMPSETAPTYPPYNIQKLGDNAYRVTLAVAGFGDDEITIEVKENLLTVSGKLARENGASESYLHRGIAAPRLRAALQSRRSHSGDRRCAREGSPAYRPGARASRSAEGAPDPHRQRRPEADRPQGLVTGRGRGIASRPRQGSGGAGLTVRAPSPSLFHVRFSAAAGSPEPVDGSFVRLRKARKLLP